MAQRLATVYVKACLELTEAEMESFICLFADHGATLQVKVLDNGNHEVVFPEDAVGENVLSFERVADKYVCRGSFRLTSPQLAGVMRKAVHQFKGNAIVNRHYTGFTMVYEYERGTVVKIAECKAGKEKVVYEYKNTLGQLERLFRRTDVEQEIGQIHSQINNLLDLRIKTQQGAVQGHIDGRLQKLSRRLFELEA